MKIIIFYLGVRRALVDGLPQINYQTMDSLV